MRTVKKTLGKRISLAKIFISIGHPFYQIIRFFLLFLLKTIKFTLRIVILPFSFVNKLIFLAKNNIFQYFKNKKKIKVKKIIPVKILKIKTENKPKTKIKLRYWVLLFIFFLSTTFISFFAFSIFSDFPSPQKLVSKSGKFTTKIYDRSGNLLYKIFKDKDRSWVNLPEISPNLIKATVAIEDKDFYRHNGVSFRGIFRALYQNLFEGKKTGGSTITQQLIKNTLLTPQKTWRRKIKEIILAILVEKKYSKNEILEMYLNDVGFGGNIYGAEEASQRYFGIKAISLSLAQASFLAGLPASPTYYSPFGENYSFAKLRQAIVLKQMVEQNYISEEEALKAKSEKLDFILQKIDIKAPHFVMFVKEILEKKYGRTFVEQGGLEVKTSLDLNIQEMAQNIVTEEINKISALKVTNGATLITRPNTGEILAMVGSKDYFAKDIDGNFNITTAQRQPGSSIKPITYTLALENGFTPSTLINDSPITYKVPGQPPYSPTNYDQRYHGNIPLKIALGSSYNVPAVKILSAFGVSKLIDKAESMGITTWKDRSRFGLSLTLGGGEVKMTDMAVAFGVFANNGYKIELNPILEVKDRFGKILEEVEINQTPVVSSKVAFLINNILSDNNNRAPAFGSNSQLYLPGKEVAVKTGTTQNLRDNWTIGYTPSYLTAVWVGNNDNTPMSYVASGVTGASPIWRKIMEKLLLNNYETFLRPQEIIEVYICGNTNTLPCEGCPNIKKEYFILGTEPKTNCDPQFFKNPTPTPS